MSYYREEAEDALKSVAAEMAAAFRHKIAFILGCQPSEIDMPTDLMSEIIGEAAYEVTSRLPEDEFEARDWAAGDVSDFRRGNAA